MILSKWKLLLTQGIIRGPTPNYSLGKCGTNSGRITEITLAIIKLSDIGPTSLAERWAVVSFQFWPNVILQPFPNGHYNIGPTLGPCLCVGWDATSVISVVSVCSCSTLNTTQRSHDCHHFSFVDTLLFHFFSSTLMKRALKTEVDGSYSMALWLDNDPAAAYMQISSLTTSILLNDNHSHTTTLNPFNLGAGFPFFLLYPLVSFSGHKELALLTIWGHRGRRYFHAVTNIKSS